MVDGKLETGKLPDIRLDDGDSINKWRAMHAEAMTFNYDFLTVARKFEVTDRNTAKTVKLKLWEAVTLT